MSSVLQALVGVGLLVFAVACWTGRITWWTRSVMPPWATVFTPALGLLLLGNALADVTDSVAVGAVLYVPCFALFVLGFVVAIKEPRWSGPRWYREARRITGWGHGVYDSGAIQRGKAIAAGLPDPAPTAPGPPDEGYDELSPFDQGDRGGR